MVECVYSIGNSDLPISRINQIRQDWSLLSPRWQWCKYISAFTIFIQYLKRTFLTSHRIILINNIVIVLDDNDWVAHVNNTIKCKVSMKWKVYTHVHVLFCNFAFAYDFICEKRKAIV